MDKKWIIAAFIAIFALSSCLEKEVYQGPEEDEKEFNDFDFSTVQSATSLEVSYANSGVKANVYFEVYDEIPVEQDEYTYTKKTNVTPLFAAYTADNSVYKGTIDLPAYLQKVYIYTPAFFAQTLIEADVTNGSIQASDSAPAKEAETRTTPTLREYDSYMATIFGVSFLLVLVFYILLWIINAIASGGFAMLLLFIVSIVYTVAALGCSAVIYRNLTAEPKPETMETVVEV